MPAAQYDILIEQDATFTLPLTLQGPGEVALNLTGWTFVARIKETYDQVVPTASFTVTIADQTLEPGKLTLSLSAATTTAISAGPASPSNQRPTKNYVYDVLATKPDGTVDRILEGAASVSGGVSA